MKVGMIITFAMITSLAATSFASPQKPAKPAGEIARKHSEMVAKFRTEAKLADGKIDVLKYRTLVSQLSGLSIDTINSMAAVPLWHKFSNRDKVTEATLAEVAVLRKLVAESENPSVRDGAGIINKFIDNATDGSVGSKDQQTNNPRALTVALLFVRQLDGLSKEEADKHIAVMKRANEIRDEKLLNFIVYFIHLLSSLLIPS